MDVSDFEAYDKEWYALPPGGEIRRKSAQFGTVLCFKHGNVSRSKLLFVPDFAKPLSSYAPLFCCLQNDFCIHSYDLAGQGGSDFAADNTYTLDAYVEQLKTVINDLGIENQSVHVAA